MSIPEKCDALEGQIGKLAATLSEVVAMRAELRRPTSTTDARTVRLVELNRDTIAALERSLDILRGRLARANTTRLSPSSSTRSIASGRG